jgi:hypothetical protein
MCFEPQSIRKDKHYNNDINFKIFKGVGIPQIAAKLC